MDLVSDVDVGLINLFCWKSDNDWCLVCVWHYYCFKETTVIWLIIRLFMELMNDHCPVKMAMSRPRCSMINDGYFYHHFPSRKLLIGIHDLKSHWLPARSVKVISEIESCLLKRVTRSSLMDVWWLATIWMVVFKVRLFARSESISMPTVVDSFINWDG